MAECFNVYFCRQILFLCAMCLTTFTLGIIAAFPSVLNPAILAPDAEIKATPDQASWITACFGISAIAAHAVIPPIFETFGGKTTNVLTNIVLLIGCILEYAAKDVYALVAARLFQGISIPGLETFAFGLCECVTPERRGYFLVCNKITLALGSMVCHALGCVLNWRIIAILSVIPISLSIIICVIIAESPSFFVFRGQYNKCVKSFIWYRGESLSAKKELKEMLAAQKETLRIKQKQKNINIFMKMKNMVKAKDFRKSLSIAILAKMSLDFCGRHFILAYITQILVEITNNQSLAMYLSVASDVVFVCALCISFFLVKYFNRRVLLLNLGFCSVFLMFMVSLSLILGSNAYLANHVKWLSPFFIFLHLFITNIGLVPLAFTLASEVFSLEHRGVGLFISGSVFLSCYTFIMKLTPMMIDKTGVEGVYSIFGTCLLFCLILLRVILIETKDKTLQEIEDELKGIVRDNWETELLN